MAEHMLTGNQVKPWSTRAFSSLQETLMRREGLFISPEARTVVDGGLATEEESSSVRKRLF